MNTHSDDMEEGQITKIPEKRDKRVEGGDGDMNTHLDDMEEGQIIKIPEKKNQRGNGSIPTSSE